MTMTLRLQRNFTRFLLCAAIAAATLLFASGCASSAKNAAPMASADAVHETPDVAAAADEADPTEPEALVDDSEGIDLIDIDEALALARQACADSLFAAADSILRRASAFLVKNSDLFNGHEQPESDAEPENQPPPLQDYVAEIISIYAELMPNSYSTPEDISALIFSQHILETLLDSIKITPQDSAFLARLSNKRGVVYDVPMVWNDRVRRALLFYLRTRNGVFDRWLHRAGYYLPVMKQMFADSGMPQDLAYLPIIESGFNPHAYSRAHAAGIWQFIPSTGRNYGLRQNYWIDERRDPLKSTGAAMKYLNKLYGDFGNWHIALASYNCGEGGMARAIRRSGNVYDYWAISLPKETMNYVPLYLASLIIAKNPDVFGFAMQDSVVFNPDTVFVNDCIEMATIAKGIDVPLDTLTRMNPHILHWCTPPDMQDVRLYVPKGYADAFREFYKELPDEKKTKFYRYRIHSGDNLLQVARNFNVPVEALREINKMKNNYISAGKYLIIPVPLSDSVPSALASRLNTTERERPSRRASYGGGSGGGQRGAAAPRTGRKISYKVRAGETLYSISNTFGVSVRDLMSWNYLASPRSLKAEQTLVIYQKEQTQTATAAAQPAPAAAPAQKARSAEAGHTGKRLVKQGETLYGISQELGVPVAELARINGLNAKRPLIFPGDVLVYTPRAGQPSGGAAEQNTAVNQSAGARPSPAASQSASAQAPRTPQPSGPVVIYTVKPGDNLWRIALNFGVTVDSIRNDNNLTANTVIMPGDILRITRGGN